MSERRYQLCWAVGLWALAFAFLALAVTVAPGAINAALGIGIVALVVSLPI